MSEHDDVIEPSSDMSGLGELPSVEELGGYLPQYEVSEVVAMGGMGGVYHAKHRSLERDVAIKVLREAYGDSEEFREAFQNEARLMGQFHHPNLISVYDFGEVDGLLYLVMEFVGDGSLHDRIQDGVVKPGDAIRYAVGICEGLQHAHEAGILHRDIKPGNVLMRGDVPMIGDFGLARLDEDGETGEVYGTPEYSAPELFKARDEVGPHTDVYAVGVVLYEMMTGKVPDLENYVPLHQCASCPPMIDQMVRRALRSDWRQRYASPAELGAALSQMVRDRNATGPVRTLKSGVAKSTKGVQIKAAGAGRKRAATRSTAPKRYVASSQGGGGAGIWLILIGLFVVVVILALVAMS